MYAVIQPDGPTRGIVLSRHRTAEAAKRAIERELLAFTRTRHGKPAAYLDREIAECERGATRAIREG